MGFLFKNNASRRQKLIGKLILIFLVTGLYGITSGVLVNEDYMMPLTWLGTGISLILIILALYSLFFKKDSKLRHRVVAKSRDSVVAVITVFIVMPLFISYAIVRGVPAGLHYLTSSPGSIIVTVEKKQANYKNKSCTGGIFLEEYNMFMNDKICGLQEDGWRTLEPGSRIRLLGKQSDFGFDFDRYQIPRRQ